MQRKLSTNAICLLLSSLLLCITLALAGCGGGDGIASGLGGALGIGRGSNSPSSSSSLGGAVSGFVGGPTGEYIDAGFKAAEALSMGPDTEVGLGQGVALALTNPPYQLLDNTELLDYVNKVGLVVAMQSQHTDFNYAFGVIDSDQIAAWSGPRGYVIVTRGAIAAMKDEAELAGVLAHEVAHSARRHAIADLKKRKLVSSGLQAATAEGQLGAARDMINASIETLVNNGWSQAQESEADKDAVHYLVAAGYDPKPYARFLDTMGNSGAQRNNAPLLKTHPGINQRIRTVNQTISQLNTPSGQTNQPRFQQFTAAIQKQ